jgi:hypothetical protein
MAPDCWAFGVKAYRGDRNHAESIATVHAALAAGIPFFDTAEGHGAGESERVPGRALRGRRDKAVIATGVSKTDLAPADGIDVCDSNALRGRIEDERGAEAHVQAHPSRAIKPPPDPDLSAGRHKVETVFQRIRRFRRIGLRCGTALASVMGFVLIVSALDWPG